MKNMTLTLDSIKSDVIDSFAQYNFRTTHEHTFAHKESVALAFHSESYGMKINTCISLLPNMMISGIDLVNVPKMKYRPMLEMINLINMDLDYGHLMLMSGSQDLLLEAKLFLSDNTANKEMISLVIRSLVNNCYRYLPLVERLLDSSEKPWDIYDKYYDPARLLIQDALQDSSAEE